MSRALCRVINSAEAHRLILVMQQPLLEHLNLMGTRISQQQPTCEWLPPHAMDGVIEALHIYDEHKYVSAGEKRRIITDNLQQCHTLAHIYRPAAVGCPSFAAVS